jgi:hypothetical protein
MPNPLNVTSTLDTATKIPDLEVTGNGDLFKLLSQKSSEAEKWAETTKAMYIPGIGCVIHTVTQQNNRISEAMVLIPGTRLDIDINHGMKVVKL